jgi:hypothetical protein
MLQKVNKCLQEQIGGVGSDLEGFMHQISKFGMGKSYSLLVGFPINWVSY